MFGYYYDQAVKVAKPFLKTVASASFQWSTNCAIDYFLPESWWIKDLCLTAVDSYWYLANQSTLEKGYTQKIGLRTPEGDVVIEYPSVLYSEGGNEELDISSDSFCANGGFWVNPYCTGAVDLGTYMRKNYGYEVIDDVSNYVFKNSTAVCPQTKFALSWLPGADFLNYNTEVVALYNDTLAAGITDTFNTNSGNCFNNNEISSWLMFLTPIVVGGVVAALPCVCVIGGTIFIGYQLNKDRATDNQQYSSPEKRHLLEKKDSDGLDGEERGMGKRSP